MIVVYSLLAGMVWGGLFGLIGAGLTKKMASGDQRKIAALSMIRMLIDVAALAAVFFTRDLLPLRFEYTLIASAVAMSLVGIVAAFRVASSMKK